MKTERLQDDMIPTSHSSEVASSTSAFWPKSELNSKSEAIRQPFEPMLAGKFLAEYLDSDTNDAVESILASLRDLRNPTTTPVHLATGLYSVGGHLMQLNLYSQALHVFDSALAIYTMLYQREPELLSSILANTLMMVAHAHGRMDDHRTSEQMLLRASKIYEDWPPTSDFDRESLCRLQMRLAAYRVWNDQH